MNKEIKQIVQDAESRGWTREPSRNGHIKLRHPTTGRMVVMASTPSDVRALKNIRAELKRKEREAENEGGRNLEARCRF